MFSLDGRTTMEQLIETAKERGIGCIAVTDHNEFKAFDLLKDNKDVIIIPAEEVSSTEGHIIALGIDRQIPKGHSIEDTVRMIHEAGGYAFAAHPYRWWSGLGEKNTRNPVFDGVEARNSRSVPSANRKSEKLAAEIGKPITAGSDAHIPKHIGLGYVEIPDTVTTWQEAVKAIVDGDIQGVFSVSRGVFGTIHYGTKSIGEWMLRGFKKM
jgi:hypothetical protein